MCRPGHDLLGRRACPERRGLHSSMKPCRREAHGPSLACRRSVMCDDRERHPDRRRLAFIRTFIPGVIQSRRKARRRRDPGMTSQNLRILVVDDSAIARGFWARILDAEPDMRVVASAGNGRTAVDVVRRRPVDVVVLDVEMPEMDGLEALPLSARRPPRDPRRHGLVAHAQRRQGHDRGAVARRRGLRRQALGLGPQVPGAGRGRTRPEDPCARRSARAAPACRTHPERRLAGRGRRGPRGPPCPR